MLSERHDDGLVLNGKDGGSGFWRAGGSVSDRATLLPFCHRLGVDAVALGQDPQALLTMLYRSTDCRSRCGAAVENLAHSASFHSREKTAPSKSGIKHLVQGTMSDNFGDISHPRHCRDNG